MNKKTAFVLLFLAVLLAVMALMPRLIDMDGLGEETTLREQSAVADEELRGIMFSIYGDSVEYDIPEENQEQLESLMIDATVRPCREPAKARLLGYALLVYNDGHFTHHMNVHMYEGNYIEVEEAKEEYLEPKYYLVTDENWSLEDMAALGRIVQAPTFTMIPQLEETEAFTVTDLNTGEEIPLDADRFKEFIKDFYPYIDERTQLDKSMFSYAIGFDGGTLYMGMNYWKIEWDDGAETQYSQVNSALVEFRKLINE